MASASKSKRIYASNGVTGGYYDLEVSFVENSNDVSTNKSNITVTATITSHSISYSGASRNTWNIYWADNHNHATPLYLTSESITSLGRNTSKSISYTFDVEHNSDGNLIGHAQVNYNNVGTGYAPSSNSVATDDTALTYNPRYAQITHFYVSATNETTIYVNFGVDVPIDYSQYRYQSYNNGSWSSWTNWTDTGVSADAREFNINNLTDGTQYNVQIRVRRADSGKWTESDVDNATTWEYPYVPQNFLRNIVIGDDFPIFVWNPVERQYTLQLIQKGTNTVLASYSGNESGFVYGFNDNTTITNLYASLTAGNSSGYYCKVITNSVVKTTDNNAIYEVNEALCKPTVSATIEDVNQATLDLTNDSSQIIKGFSTARVTATATKISDSRDLNTTIDKYTIDGIDVTTSPYRRDISNATTLDYAVTTTNSRQVTSDGVYPTGATIHPYFDLTITDCDFKRPSPTGTTMTASFSGSFYNDYFDTTNNDNHNTLTLKWYVRVSDQDSWTLGGTFVENTDYTITNNDYESDGYVSITCPQTITSGEWDYMTKYYFKLEAADLLQSVLIQDYVTIGQPYFDWWTENGINYFNVNGEYLKNNQPFSGGGGVTGDTFPIGGILPYPGENAPTNWLICDGSAVSRSDYSELFAVIGTTYGSGDGSTTFNLPDIKGRVVMGGGMPSQNSFNGFGTLTNDELSMNFGPATLGEYSHPLSTNELPEHSFYELFWDITPFNLRPFAESSSGPRGLSVDGGVYQEWNPHTKSIGDNQRHTNVQPSTVVKHWIIKAKQSAGVVANVTDVYSESTTDPYSAHYVNTVKSSLENDISSINNKLSDEWKYAPVSQDMIYYGHFQYQKSLLKKVDDRYQFSYWGTTKTGYKKWYRMRALKNDNVSSGDGLVVYFSYNDRQIFWGFSGTCGSGGDDHGGWSYSHEWYSLDDLNGGWVDINVIIPDASDGSSGYLKQLWIDCYDVPNGVNPNNV